MVILIKNNLKLFFKSRYIVLGFLILFIAVNAYLADEFYKLSIHRNTLYYLEQSQRLSILCFVFFVFVSYEYLMKSKNADTLECFTAINNGKINLYFSKLVVLIFIIFVITLNVMVYNYVAYFTMNVNSSAYAHHIFLNNFLNIFLVSILGSCIGIIITLYLKRFPAYLSMIFLTVLISPIVDFVPYILFMGFDINIYPLRDVFNILPPNLNWVVEALYGLSIEPYRWNLLIFWISFLGFFILRNLSNKKIKYLNWLSVLLIVLSIYNFYLYTQPGSIVRKDYNPKNYTAFDELYYSKDVQKEEDAEFKILGYDMTIDVDRQLNNNVKITLKEKEALGSYKFTLYRNYKIEKILDNKGKILEFKRDGDYLEVYNPNNEKLEEIRIVYSGYSPVFYSNSQGILLPGCFPYYPVEGYKKIYVKEQSSYISIIRDYNVKFNVSVDSDTEIYSNLEKKGDNFFGEAQAVTLVGGLVEEKKIGDNIFYGLPLEELNTEALLKINDILEPYKNMFPDNDKFDISSIKIFQAPITFASRVMDNGIVSFKDHIFVYGLSKENIVQGFLQSVMPNNVDKMELNTIFFNCLLYKTRQLNIPEGLENSEAYELRKLFIEKVSDLGESYVLKSTYDYLMDKYDTRNSITFIKDLKKGGL